MTVVIELSAPQLRHIRAYNRDIGQRIKRAAKRTVAPQRDFVFFAAFDGTNNDKDDLCGDPQCTNIGQLWNQYRVRAGDGANLGGNYYPGLGTKGSPRRNTWMPTAVTEQVRATARKACQDLTMQAADWLAGRPDGTITVVLAAFSRGVASAAVFSQILCRDGLKLGQVRVPPGKLRVRAGVLFDPVATGVAGNLAFAPGVSNLVVIKALNEYRHLFKAVDYSCQSDVVTTFAMYGNHCDIGGGYDNGIGAISLEAATVFLRKTGLPLAKVPQTRRFHAGSIAIHSEEFDHHGHKIWDVYNDDGFSFVDERLYSHEVAVVPASAPDATGTRQFTLYDGTKIVI
jgi:hypothetical protein